MLCLEILGRCAREYEYRDIRREQGGEREPGENDTVSVPHAFDEE